PPQVFDQQPHSYSAGPLGTAGPCLVAPGGTGNIQMGPACAADKLFQEPAGGNTAAVAAPGVLQIGDIALHDLSVAVPQRQLPDPLSAALSGPLQGIHQPPVIAHQAAGLMPQGDNAGSGQGGKVDHNRRLVLPGEMQGVAQDQTALGI